MSGYRIVLNLTGDASRKINGLANDLARAEISATALASSLNRVALASHGIKPLDLREPKTGSTRSERVRRPDVRREQLREPREPHYTRHTGTRIGSYGVGGSIGGFSGRLSTIIQPDANGNLFGMNAEKLMKSANVVAIASSLMMSVGKAILKVTAAATLAPIVIGGGGLMMAINALQSEGFAEGVRLISRRHQAKLGLGADYERGQASADFLAASYGFDRSTALSSINVLSGMGVGGSARKLTTAEATGLTKVGGLISQQSGVSYERVMTNIQQLLAQAVPHLRDIRELVNQAPILNKYALKDMEEKGVKGVSALAWLKDVGNIMNVMKRYEADLASNSGMRARGEIDLAFKDFWVKIAGNKAWTQVGVMGSDVIESAGSAVNSLLTSLMNNDSFKVMVANIESIFDALEENGGEFFQTLTDFVDSMYQKFGLPVPDPAKARGKVEKVNAVRELMADEKFTKWILSRADQAGVYADIPKNTELRSLKDEEILTAVGKKLSRNKDFLVGITGEYEAARDENWWMAIKNADYSVRGLSNFIGSTLSNTGLAFLPTYISDPYKKAGFGSFSSEEINQQKAGLAFTAPQYKNDTTFTAKTKSLYASLGGKQDNPIGNFMLLNINTNKAYDIADDYFKSLVSTAGGVPNINGKEDPAGSDFTGMNRDRRALEIHFNAPIVEWNATIEATSPSETVQLVKENIELIAATAIQKALLGASNKMSKTF